MDRKRKRSMDLISLAARKRKGENLVQDLYEDNISPPYHIRRHYMEIRPQKTDYDTVYYQGNECSTRSNDTIISSHTRMTYFDDKVCWSSNFVLKATIHAASINMYRHKHNFIGVHPQMI